MTPNPQWRDDANCIGKDPALFFPLGPGDQTSAARAVCQRCPVIAECLDEALRMGDTFGFRGGMAGEARRRLLAVRNRRALGAA